MFEHTPDYDAFYTPAGANADEADRAALAWLLKQPGEPLILFHAKKMIRNNGLIQATATRHKIPVEAPGTVHRSGWGNGAILAPWASDGVLRCIDDDLSGRTSAVCVIGWMPGEHDSWIAARQATNLLSGEKVISSPASLIGDPVVRLALDNASLIVNHNNGLVQSVDKTWAIRTLQILLQGGHTFTADEIGTYAMATGWTGGEVKLLREYAQGVLDGKGYKVSSGYGPRPGACQSWEAEASGS
jgi:hypothetical protein